MDTGAEHRDVLAKAIYGVFQRGFELADAYPAEYALVAGEIVRHHDWHGLVIDTEKASGLLTVAALSAVVLVCVKGACNGVSK